MAQNVKKGRFVLLFLLFMLTGCSMSPKGEVVPYDDRETQIETGNGEMPDKQNEMSGKDSNLIWVHVCGAVKKPGVYSLKKGSRVFDALDAAGGFTKKADKDGLNLAAILEDESRIEVLTRQTGKREETGHAGKGQTGESRVNLNTAEMEDLMTIPGIGEKRAEAILSFREEKGTFTKIEDLLKIEGIKEGIFNAIKDYIMV